MLCEDTHGNKFLVKAINNCDRPWNSEEVNMCFFFSHKSCYSHYNWEATWEARDGAVLRALASHQCGLCRFKSWHQRHFDIQGWVCCWFSPLLREVFSRYSRFPLFPNTNISKFLFNQESGRLRTSLWMCYLQIIIIIYYYFLSSQCTCPETQRPEFSSFSVYQQLDLFLSSPKNNISTTVNCTYILGTLRCLLWLTSNTGFSIIVYLKLLSRWQKL